MTDRLTELEQELAKNRTRYERARDGLVKARRSLDALPRIRDLAIDGVSKFVVARTRLQAESEIYAQIASDCQAYEDAFTREINQLQLSYAPKPQRREVRA